MSTRKSNRQATVPALPIVGAPAGPNFPADHAPGATQTQGVGGEPKPVEQRDQTTVVSQMADVSLFDPTLSTLAEALDDAESVRIAQENRLRALTGKSKDGTRRLIDKDGVARSADLPDDHPAVVVLAAQVEALKALNNQLTKALQKQLKAHPLGPFVLAQKGLGPKTVGRLLATIGDPYWNEREQRPRTEVGELFAFCGIAGRQRRGDIAAANRSRSAGDKLRMNWNPTARKWLFVIAEVTMKGDGPYRAVYEDGRRKYEHAVHLEPCMNTSRINPNGCGTRANPEWGEVGSPWRPGHQNKAALRLVMREIARDLWAEAKRIHELGTGQRNADIQNDRVGADQTNRGAA